MDSPCIDIGGLNVWIYRDGAQWIAQGIEVDYAAAAETQEQARSLFSVGLMMSLIENVRRFGNVHRFISKRAPREIEEAWLLAKPGLLSEIEPLQLPPDAFEEPQEKLGVPPHIHYYKEPDSSREELFHPARDEH
jgi:hypothetical protein